VHLRSRLRSIQWDSRRLFSSGEQGGHGIWHQQSLNWIFTWLVVWNMAFVFPYIRNDNPNWLMFFRGVAQPPTSYNRLQPLTQEWPEIRPVDVGFNHSGSASMAKDRKSWLYNFINFNAWVLTKFVAVVALFLTPIDFKGGKGRQEPCKHSFFSVSPHVDQLNHLTPYFVAWTCISDILAAEPQISRHHVLVASLG
jgi:hypothetical protein